MAMSTEEFTDLRNAGPQTFLDDGLAACRSVKDPELFFPNQGDTGIEAKRVCWRCDIRPGCRAWSVPIRGLAGIWGGLSPWERDNWRKRGWR